MGDMMKYHIMDMGGEGRWCFLTVEGTALGERKPRRSSEETCNALARSVSMALGGAGLFRPHSRR